MLGGGKCGPNATLQEQRTQLALQATLRRPPPQSALPSCTPCARCPGCPAVCMARKRGLHTSVPVICESPGQTPQNPQDRAWIAWLSRAAGPGSAAGGRGPARRLLTHAKVAGAPPPRRPGLLASPALTLRAFHKHAGKMDGRKLLVTILAGQLHGRAERRLRLARELLGVQHLSRGPSVCAERDECRPGELARCAQAC